MSKTELKRCPFCDGTAILIQNPTAYGKVYHYVSCIECGNRTRLYKSTKTAEKKWNRRVNEGMITISRSELDALNEYEEMIKKAKVIMPDVAEGKWIPVEERLPEKSGKYLCFVSDCDYFSVLPYSRENKKFNAFDEGYAEYAIDVTHWMPLPEPPKGVTE